MEGRSKRSIIILGCTGSVGTTALQALEHYAHEFEIVGLSAHSNVRQLADIATRYNCKHVAITGTFDAPNLTNLFAPDVALHFGKSGLLEMIQNVDAYMVLNAISGADGLEPTFAAISSHKHLALSNKESVVMAGDLLFEHARKHNTKIIPVDSEHSALYALVNTFGKEEVEHLVITASGGPFRLTPLDQMKDITVDMALAHPTWKMGPKISVDSATMANKGLEIMEASFLFGFEASSIEVVIHPQSIVHSLIRLHSGALYAQLSPPDIALPVMAALSEDFLALRNAVRPLDFTDLQLNFSAPDFTRFPLIQHAYTCTQTRYAYPIAYNASNEIAVQAFFEGQIPFTKIADIVAQTLEFDWMQSVDSLAKIQSIDKEVRRKAAVLVKRSR
ncbi:MAG: 1-deoxy-D-xylulose-5-phosphate reductoisomerase [Sphaerochaetaceae bacterium]